MYSNNDIISVHIGGYMKVKKCTKCREEKPATKEFFKVPVKMEDLGQIVKNVLTLEEGKTGKLKTELMLKEEKDIRKI
jgi:hypothetical protein